jgi:pimeloyl-ACP methyl ester carboxylesterase
VKLPALVITGSRDLITPPRLGSAIARAMPNAEFEVVPHGGHMLMLERRDWLNGRITAFAEQRVPITSST